MIKSAKGLPVEFRNLVVIFRMSTNAIQASPAFEEIEALCIHLFDIWCERRSVVPLTYLMQSWPMPTLSSLVVTRLVSGFQDLLRFHAESLAADETELLTSVIALADELRRGPFSDTINHAALLPYAGGEVSGAACARDMRVSDDSAPFEKLVC